MDAHVSGAGVTNLFPLILVLLAEEPNNSWRRPSYTGPYLPPDHHAVSWQPVGTRDSRSPSYGRHA